MFKHMKFRQSEQTDATQKTIIGQSAVVVGNIVSQDVVQLKGHVVGNIESTGRVELHAGADVKGNISYATMAIEHGAKVYGMMSSTDVKQR